VPRGQQQIRQWRLLHLLASRRGRTIPELMREVGCSRRTAWRDLEVLQAVGFPITNERDGRESRYRLIEGARGLPPIPFTLTELLSLHLGRHLLLPLRATPFGEPIQTALQKITATLAPETKAFLERLNRELSARTIHTKDYSRSLPILQTIQEATGRRVVLEGEYHSFGRDVVGWRRLNPLHLWYQQGGIYLAAFCHRNQDVRTFAVERFRAVRLTDIPFEVPAGFDPDRYLKGSFGLFRGQPVQVALRFSRAVARYIAEREWHPSQVAAPLLTGELDLTLQAPICPELKRWIMSYGKEVEVLQPKSLRDEIRREWLAALRGTGGRAEPPRMAVRKGDRQSRPVREPALAVREGKPAQPRRALPRLRSKR